MYLIKYESEPDNHTGQVIGLGTTKINTIILATKHVDEMRVKYENANLAHAQELTQEFRDSLYIYEIEPDSMVKVGPPMRYAALKNSLDVTRAELPTEIQPVPNVMLDSDGLLMLDPDEGIHTLLVGLTVAHRIEPQLKMSLYQLGEFWEKNPLSLQAVNNGDRIVKFLAFIQQNHG